MGNSAYSRSSTSAPNFIAAPAEKSLEQLTRWPHRTSWSHCVQKPDTRALIVKKILKKEKNTHTEAQWAKRTQEAASWQRTRDDEQWRPWQQRWTVFVGARASQQKDSKRGMWSKQLAEKTAILFGADTAAVPDMPCSEQLKTCSVYTLSLHITPHSSMDVWIQESSERFTTFIIPCSVVPDVHKI